MNNTHSNAIEWFEIPTGDFAKSIPFYNQLLGAKLESVEFGSGHIAVFPYDRPGVGGCLLHEKGLTPGATGAIVYLPVKNVDAAVAQVEPAGGKVVIPKTPVEHWLLRSSSRCRRKPGWHIWHGMIMELAPR